MHLATRDRFESRALLAVTFTVAILVGLFLASVAHAQEVVLGPVAPVSTPGDFLRSLLPALFAALATVVSGVIVVLGKALRGWLTEKAKTSALAGAALKVDVVAEAIVAHINAGMKKKLEELSADGELSKDDVVALKGEGMRLLKESLGEQGLTTLAGALGLGASVVDTFLSGVLERKVEAAKPAVESPK